MDNQRVKMRILSLVAVAALAAAMVGCKKDEATGDGTAAGTESGQGLQPGETKTEAGGGGAAAPSDAMAAPPGTKTGTPDGN